ncbi:MAG: YbaB/EbfC family nucleoid-associated protein [Bacteroidales bacterium]|nr:YbaB/EbfC family nucleoid-associated protein [Bacteroidales bacterium]MCF8404056.1 YbaB/EbfC family nucleoid-associated protein [Bacteroidales bacterium]
MTGDLFSKLQEARQKIEESKKKLNSLIVEKSSPDGKIHVKANANRVITSIEISGELIHNDNKEELEDVLLTLINRALDEAAQKGEIEMKNITSELLPNFPGLV